MVLDDPVCSTMDMDEAHPATDRVKECQTQPVASPDGGTCRRGVEFELQPECFHLWLSLEDSFTSNLAARVDPDSVREGSFPIMRVIEFARTTSWMDKHATGTGMPS